MTSRITALPNLRRNLAWIWGLWAFENWSRYMTWHPTGFRTWWKTSLAAYALSQAVTWWLLSWVVFWMIDVTASKRRRVALPLAGLVILACTLLSTLDRSYFLTAVGPSRWTFGMELEYLLRGDFYLTLMWVAAVAALGRGLQWWHVEKSAALRRASLEAERAQAELSALSAQLEPHFLFNTLSGISTIAARDPAGATEMLEGLRELLAYTSRPSPSVTLADEMRFASHYLRLQSVRFAERLRVAIDVDPRSLACVVPQLLLQPVVENAIRHGIEQIEEGGEIAIGGRLERGRLLLFVRNSDAGEGGRASAGHGVGLASVQARLDLLYGGAHSFAIDRDPASKSVTVRMSMPELREAS